MPTKTTTKTAARKPATARKPVKAAAPAKTAQEPKRREAKNVKVEAPAKGLRSIAPAPESKTRAPVESPKEVDTPKPAAKRTIETVSLIEEKKPRQKRTDGDASTKRSFLPPISRIHATLESPAVAVAPAPV